ncbi:hypothetical protein [Bradyrhizobium sp.]|uniref:hypothetical protein n=1 Tax=Bradyrhizobium sp. TaxID=376 RepID=UPI0039E6950C
MTGDAPLSWLMFFTLAAGVIVAAGFFLSFLRSRHNREVAAYALEGNGRSRGVEPSGAGAELAGLFAVALIAMALLTFGYRSHSGTAVSEVAQRNNQLSTERTDPTTPKPYQPQNPAPDTRTAPTGSSSGSGPDSGGHQEGTQK